MIEKWPQTAVVTKFQSCHHLEWFSMDSLKITYIAEKSRPTANVNTYECYGWCGSGNFLYVALEHFKRLEGEIQNVLRDLSDGQDSFDTGGLTVDPHQFLGLEINPRAAAIAEMVLWIGYLQWHYRLHGSLNLPEPILRNFNNIENRDALIEYDDREPIFDAQGNPVTIWDGTSYKASPITNELIPDTTQQIPVYNYTNPRQATWPEAEILIGNPPFIGDKAMRRALGGGYVDALRKAWGVIPESTDFVMYWWHIAAEKVRHGQADRFGFITTNSIRQTFNRRVVERHLTDKKRPLSIAFAIPDHPWVDSNDGAAVRISMTTGVSGDVPGTLKQVYQEDRKGEESRSVLMRQRNGKIFADLSAGANVAGAGKLQSNGGITSNGVMLAGSGFIVTVEQAEALGYPDRPGIKHIIRNYRNGRDLTQQPRGAMVIDLFGLEPGQIREDYPEVYQWVVDQVKPERDSNRRKKLKEKWWLFGETRVTWRTVSKGLPRYVSTVETMKHRIFCFLEADILPDHKLVNIAVDDGANLGVLSSRIHCCWAMFSGSWLGVGNDSVYAKSRCFETFPFPDLSDDQANTINTIAEQIDAHRKSQQLQHPDLTLTGIYNVLEKARAEIPLSDKERAIHEKGLVSILRELHDDLDRAVFAAYGWNDLSEILVGRPGATTPLPDKPTEQAIGEEELLSRLVSLNTERLAEEAQGLIRWLRAACQDPKTKQFHLIPEAADEADITVKAATKPTWPKTMPDQVEAIRQLLAIGGQSEEALAEQFKRKPIKSVRQVLAALEVFGRASKVEELWRLT